MKIGTHGILEMLIPNPTLELRKSDPRIWFWANLCRKSQSSPFWLKIGTNGKQLDHNLFWANLA